jgi:hypothetical protein
VLLSSEELAALFRDFKSSAFRMETHPVYTMAGEQAGLARFLAGESKPEGHNSGWRDTVRRNLDAGKTMRRVKVVRRPFTDYTRFLFAWAIPGNVEAGEDYRILDVSDRAVGIPEQDFWVFDESTAVLLNFNADGTLRDRELVDSSDVGKYLYWRDIALAESVTFGEYRT